MKRNTVFLLTALAAIISHSASARDLLPERWMEDLPAVDNSVQRCLVFRTVPGVLYRVEVSTDLNNWETEMEIYGLGQEIAAPLVQINPPPNGTSSPPSSIPIIASLLLRPALSPATGTIVSWRSLDDGTVRLAHVPQEMHPAWAAVPLYAHRFGEFQFHITHPGDPAEPPEEDPILGPVDATIFQEFGAHFAEMNQEVAESASQARLAPNPAPASSGRRFSASM